MNWLQIRWIRLWKKHPFEIHYKYSIEEKDDFKVIEISQLRCDASKELPHDLPVLFPHGRSISKAKHRDLMSLMKYVPPIHQEFYNTLKVDGSTMENDVEVADDIIDESDEDDMGETFEYTTEIDVEIIEQSEPAEVSIVTSNSATKVFAAASQKLSKTTTSEPRATPCRKISETTTSNPRATSCRKIPETKTSKSRVTPCRKISETATSNPRAIPCRKSPATKSSNSPDTQSPKLLARKTSSSQGNPGEHSHLQSMPKTRSQLSANNTRKENAAGFPRSDNVKTILKRAR